MRNAKELIVLGRLHFVLGGLLLYCLGYLLAVSAGISLSTDRFLWGYAIVFAAHLSVSYSNDFFDMVEDRISNPTLISGGSGILVKNPELANTARMIALFSIGISFLAAAGFVYYYHFSPLLLLYVSLGVICSWYYSAPPLRFSHKLYGNTILALSICILIPGFGNYIASGKITSDMWALAIPLLFYGYAFSIGVQIPDIEADRINRKKNFASLLGERASFWAIAALSLLASVAIFAIPHIFNMFYISSIFYTSWLLQSELNYWTIPIFSLFPVAASILGLVSERHSSIRAAAIVSSIFLFVALCDAYLAFSRLL